VTKPSHRDLMVFFLFTLINLGTAMVIRKNWWKIR